jgi:hypothetical protein
MMPTDRSSRLLSANRELRSFLARVDGMVHGTADIGAGDLRELGRLLRSMAPEISEGSSHVSVDAALRALIQEYTGNLRALQSSLDQVRCVMLARRVQMEAAGQRLQGLQSWTSAYRQTT